MAENKMEAVLSFKLDDKGLKDAEKELQTLEKQLDNLNKQQSKASSEGEGKGPTKQSAAALQKQIDETQARIKMNKLQQGDPELSKQLTESVKGRVGDRDPKKMLAKTLEDVIGKALNEVIGGLKDAVKDPAIARARDKMKRGGAQAMGGKVGPVSPGDAPAREEGAEESALESSFGPPPGETRNQKLRRLQREKKARDQKKAEDRAQAAQDSQAAQGDEPEAQAEAGTTQRRRRGGRIRNRAANRATDRFVSNQPLGPYEDVAPEPDNMRGEPDRRPYISRNTKTTRARGNSGYLLNRDQAALENLAAQDLAASAFEERIQSSAEAGEARAERARRDQREGGAYRPNQQKYRPRGSVNLPVSTTSQRRTGSIPSWYRVRTPEEVALSPKVTPFLSAQPELNVFENLPQGANPAGAVTPAPRLSDAAADMFVEPKPVEPAAPPPPPPDDSWKAKYKKGAYGPPRVSGSTGPEHYVPPAPTVSTSLPVGPSGSLSGLFTALSQGLTNQVHGRPMSPPASSPAAAPGTGAADFSDVRLPSDKMFERLPVPPPTTPPPEKEAYTPSKRVYAGPEEFIAYRDPAAPAPKMSTDARAKSKEASGFVTDVLKEREKEDADAAKVEKKHAEALGKEVETRKEVYKKLEGATSASEAFENHLKTAGTSPREMKRGAELAGEAYKSYRGAFTDAEKIGDKGAAKEASDAMAKLTETVKTQKDAYVGGIKETNNFSEHLSAISKKADLLTTKDSLMERFQAEPDKAQRKEYAQQLNVTNKRLQDFISDPAEKRALTKENNARNKEYGINADMMASFGQFLAGNVLLQSSRSMRTPYTVSNQAFDAYNQQHQVDPALLSSQRANQAAMIDMGGGFSSYNQLKSGLLGMALRSPAAPGAAIAGDLAGAIAGPAGSMMQTGASLKMVATDNKMLSSLLDVGGKAGVLGLAGIAGGVVGLGLGSAISGGKDPFKTIQTMIDPKGASQNQQIADYGGKIAHLTPQQLALVGPRTAKGQSAYDKYNEKKALLDTTQDGPEAVPDQYDYNQKIVGPDGKVTYAKIKTNSGASPTNASGAPSGTKMVPKTERDQAKKDQESALEDLYNQANEIVKITNNGRGIENPAYRKNAEYLKGIIQTFQESMMEGGAKSIGVAKTLIQNDPSLALQAKQLNESFNDFYVDMAHNVFKLDQGRTRQLEDFAKTDSRTTRDFGIQLGRLGVSRTRAAEDNTLANQQNDLGISRTRRDVGIQMQRLDEDLTKQRFRLAQDDAKARVRLEEDTTKQTVRLHEDVERSYKRTSDAVNLQLTRTEQDMAKSWARAVEDATKTSVRTTEDAQKTMTRAFEDAQLTRSRLVQDTNTSRSRLLEDTGTSRSRLAQDYNQTVKNQNRNYTRSNQDLDQSYRDSVIGVVAPGLASNPAYNLMKLTRDYTKNKSRLGEDYTTNRDELNKNTDRSFADLAKSLDRGLADIQKSFDRTIQDVAKSFQRTTEDVNLTLKRTAEDLATSLGRLEQDISTTLSRALQDAAKSLQIAAEDASVSLTRGMADINQNLTRSLDDLNQNFIRATQDMQVEEFRARFDAQKGLMDAEIDYQTNRNKIQLDYNRTVQDLDNAEADMRRAFNDTMVDLHTTEKRAAQDYEDARNQLNLSMTRFNRDFDNSLTSLAISLEQAGGLITSTSLEVLKKAITDINNAGGAQVDAINNAAANAGNNAGAGVAASVAANAAAGLRNGNRGGSGSGTGGGNGSVPASNDPNNSVPGLNGFDHIPKDGFPAVLHEGEMVITRGESDTLRKAGYRPESKNLSEAIPALVGSLPKFAGGYNSNPGFDYRNTYGGASAGNSITDPSAQVGGATWFRNQEIVRAAEETVANEQAQAAKAPGYRGAVPVGWDKSTLTGTAWQNPFAKGGKEWSLRDYVAMQQQVGGYGNPADPVGYMNKQRQQAGKQPYLGDPNATAATAGVSVSEALHGKGDGGPNNLFEKWLNKLPRYAGGWDGTSILQPTQVQSGFQRNLAGEQYLQRVWNPGVLNGAGVPSGGTQYAHRPADPLTPYGHQVMSNGWYQPPGDAYHATPAYFSGLPEHTGWSGGAGGYAKSAASSMSIGSYSNSGIGTPGLLTNGSTRGIISATSDITPPASTMSGGGSFSARAGNVTVNVSFSGSTNSHLQQIISQSANAFARNLSAQKLQIS